MRVYLIKRHRALYGCEDKMCRISVYENAIKKGKISNQIIPANASRYLFFKGL
jgi:hypothetical protein